MLALHSLEETPVAHQKWGGDGGPAGGRLPWVMHMVPAGATKVGAAAVVAAAAFIWKQTNKQTLF